MVTKKTVKFFFILILLLIVIFLFYLKFFKKISVNEIKPQKTEDIVYSSNIIKDVEYISKDADGNEYIITSLQGEIDYSDPNIIYLTDVKGLIKLKDSDIITILSDYGKYNTSNFDTIFSKNVIINYLDNKILGEYLDFSIKRNSMIISKNVVYSNLENILKADVIEMNIKTKDTKIYMYENEKKVNVKSKN